MSEDNTTPDGEVSEESIPLSQVNKLIEERVTQVLNDRAAAEREMTQHRHNKEDSALSDCATLMKESPEPWVDLIGYRNTEQGLKIKLDWNDAFVEFLKHEGYTGVDEDAIVHKWVAQCMRFITDETNQNGDDDL